MLGGKFSEVGLGDMKKAFCRGWGGAISFKALQHKGTAGHPQEKQALIARRV
jgi:hypothetical protein